MDALTLDGRAAIVTGVGGQGRDRRGHRDHRAQLRPGTA
jgi:hypothetical protein